MGEAKGKKLRGMVAAVFVTGIAAAESPNPYELIATRNVFGLKPPAPVPALQEPRPPEKPLPEVTLTGIADFSLKKWALIVAAERGKPPKNYTLSEGAQADGIEVLGIDAESGTVQVRLERVEMTLSFKAQEQKQLLVRAEEKRFVDEHTRAHAMREQREAERRARERAEVERQKL